MPSVTMTLHLNYGYAACSVYVIKNRLFGRLLALFDVDVFGTRKCFNFDVIRMEYQNVPKKPNFVAAVVFSIKLDNLITK